MSEPKERPILFNGAMVRAILDGTKTQTRRVIKPTWSRCLDLADHDDRTRAIDMCPYGVAGDRLWVRESHAWVDSFFGSPLEDPCHVGYRADHEVRWFNDAGSVVLDSQGLNWEHESLRWRPSIHMPRWASRITLEVTEVRVERVQDISEEDAGAEGVMRSAKWGTREGFRRLWNKINGPRGFGWDANPWCWVISFRRVG